LGVDLDLGAHLIELSVSVLVLRLLQGLLRCLEVHLVGLLAQGRQRIEPRVLDPLQVFRDMNLVVVSRVDLDLLPIVHLSILFLCPTSIGADLGIERLKA